LRERVQDYRGGAVHAGELQVRVELHDGVPGFVVLQGERVLARRRFEQLSAACSERRDTLALAIVVALANVSTTQTTAPAAASAESEAPAKTADRSSPSPALTGGRRAPASAPSEPATAHSGTLLVKKRTTTTHDAEEDASPGAGPLDPTAAPRGSVRDESHAMSEAQDHASARSSPGTPAESTASNSGSGAAAAAAIGTQDHEPQQHDASASRASIATSDGPGWRCCDVGFAVGARYGLQLLPDPVWLFGVGIEVGLAQLMSLQAAGLASPNTDSDADGGRMRAQFTGGELLLCARPVFASMALRTCGGAGAASVSVRGEDFLVDHRTRLTWFGALARAALRWPADALVAVELVLGGHVNLVRPRMLVLGSSEPDRVSWLLGGSVGVQLAVTL
jgi:hypothetical protein